jgi:hypothetical protein
MSEGKKREIQKQLFIDYFKSPQLGPPCKGQREPGTPETRHNPKQAEEHPSSMFT